MATSDGVGWLLGDAGSGFWIGHRVARAVAAALDGRAPATTLVGAVLADLDIADDDRRGSQGRALALGTLVSAVYRMCRSSWPGSPASPSKPHTNGDEVAGRIVDEAGRELATTVTTVVAPHVTGPVVLGGSVLAVNQPSPPASSPRSAERRDRPVRHGRRRHRGRRRARPAARWRRGGGGDVRAHPHHPCATALTERSRRGPISSGRMRLSKPVDERRNEILDVACEVVIERGFGATRVQDVASALGVSTGLIHYHFDNKDALLSAAFHHAAERDLAAPRQRGRRGRAAPLAKLLTLIELYAPEVAEAGWMMWIDAWGEALRNPTCARSARTSTSPGRAASKR